MPIHDYEKPAVDGQSALDLLQAAWGLDDEVYERLLEVDAGWLRRWRNHEMDPIMKPTWTRFKALLRLHEAVRLHSVPSKYGAYVNRKWRGDSILGERSIVEVVLEDGDGAIDMIANYLWAKAAGN